MRDIGSGGGVIDVISRYEDSQLRFVSNKALINHGIADFDESSNVCALDVINVAGLVLAVFGALHVNALHDLLKLFVNLWSGPVESLAVL